MQTEVLAEAIECLEKGKELIRFRVLKKLDRTDEVYHNAVMAIGHHISLLKNELHYAEKEKLANWRKAFQQSLQRTVPKQAQFARYRVHKNKKALLAVRR
jgi:hypothetical protein